MSDQWYWQTDCGELGPLTTEELVKAFEHALVRDTDRLRVEGAGEWLAALDVKGMIASARHEPVSQTTEELFGRAVFDALSKPGGGAERRIQAALLSARLKERAQKPLDPPHVSPPKVASREIAANFSVRVTVVLITLSLALVVAIIWGADLATDSPAATYDRLLSIHQKLESSRARRQDADVPLERWREDKAWLELTVKSLEKALRRQSMILDYWAPFLRGRTLRRDLLDASRRLLAMLSATETYSPKDEAAFRLAMESATSELTAPWRDPWIVSMGVIDLALLTTIGYLVWCRVFRGNRRPSGIGLSGF